MLPKLVEKKFDINVDFLWLRFLTHQNPKYMKKKLENIENKLDLKNIYINAVAFVVMNVSFFEILYHEIPSVLFFIREKL